MTREKMLFDDSMTAADLEDLLCEVGKWVDCLVAENAENNCPGPGRKDPSTTAQIKDAFDALNNCYSELACALDCIKELEK